MTAQHRRFSDDRPVNLPSFNEVRTILFQPDIVAEMACAPVIVEDYDVPDLGGSSTAVQLVRVFIDRRIAKLRPTLKRTKLKYEEWRSSVALHEQFENVLHKLRGMQYDPPDAPSSHGFATVLEHWFVEHKLSSDPEDYEQDLAEYIDESEVEDIKKPPLDLACFPYYYQPDERDIRILRHLAKLGVKDAMHPEMRQ